MKFKVQTMATAEIREAWIVEADNAEAAGNAIVDGNDGALSIEHIDDEVIGDEEGREILHVEPLAGVELSLPVADHKSPIVGDGLKTWTFDAAGDGSLYGEEFEAASREEAERLAVKALNRSWNSSYPDWDEMASDIDACDLIEWPAVMAPRMPAATLAAYRRLADGLSDMVEGGRLRECDIPDDYRWLVDALVGIAAADPEKAGEALS